MKFYKTKFSFNKNVSINEYNLLYLLFIKIIHNNIFFYMLKCHIYPLIYTLNICFNKINDLFTFTDVRGSHIILTIEQIVKYF